MKTKDSRLQTALVGVLPKMYFNPDNLLFNLEKDIDDNWQFKISCRSKNEQVSFELLVYTEEDKDGLSKSEALASIREILETTLSKGEVIFSSEDYRFLRLICCNKCEIRKNEYTQTTGPVLEDSDISRIMTELSEGLDSGRSECSTYKWDIWKERYPRKAS